MDTGEAGLYLMRLIACALASDTDLPAAPQTVTDDDWRRVHALASRHALEAISWAGLTRNPARAARVPEDLRTQWAREADATLVRQLTFEAEREMISARLAGHGISTVPLKGAVLAQRYPAAGLRSMSDNDILFAVLERRDDGCWQPQGTGSPDPRARERAYAGAAGYIDAVMAELGYERRPTSPMETDLQYLRPPFHFELHRDLVSPRNPLYPQLDSPWPAMQPDGDVPGSFHMTLADEYVFHIAHLVKHLTSAGCGIRFLVDEAVYLRLLADTPEPERTGQHIRTRLEAMGLATYEATVRSLASALLCEPSVSPTLTDGERALWHTMLASGTFGTLEQQVANARRQAGGPGMLGNLRYVASRLYPGSEQIRAVYPVFDRHPWMLPLFPFIRLGSVIRHHPGKLLAELRLVFDRRYR